MILVILALPVMTSRGYAQEIRIDVKEHILKNGMKVIVLPRHNLPVFTGLIQFSAGSVTEKFGITGISHLLEHMMFKGSRELGTTNYKAEIPIMKEIDRIATLWYAEKAKLRTAYGKGDPKKLKEYEGQIKSLIDKQRQYMVKNELLDTYMRNGCSELDASTGEESVQYYVSLPSNRLELWAFIESDRMAHPVLREFYSERDVVNEERRMGQNEPRGKLYQEFMATAFMSSPYRDPIVGFESDIMTVRREDAERYFETYYAPNNSVAVLVGDVRPDEVMALMKKYFEPIPSRNPPDPMMTMETEQCGERRIEVEADSHPVVMIGYHGACFGSMDESVLDVIAALLSQGRTSRLNVNLVEKKHLALTVSCHNNTKRYASLFIFNGEPKAPATPAKLEQAIYEEIEKLKTTPVEKQELEKIFNNMEVNFVRELSSNIQMAWKLAYAYTLTGDWRNYDRRERVRTVTSQDIMRVASKYFVRQNRTVATLVKKAQAAPEKAGR